MNIKYCKWIIGGLLSMLAMSLVSSCSDDHYDIKTDPNCPSASKNLWDNLTELDNCKDFQEILSKTIVNKQDYGVPATLTYEELLKSTRVMTVWAPIDGSYDAKKWLDLLEEGDNETVELQFVGNHIASCNYNGSFPKVQTIMLMNQKTAVYDDSSAVNTFNGSPISAVNKNVPSLNGTLHLLEAPSAFVPNVRELLALYDEVSDLYNYVESRDTIVFNESSSTPGTIIEGHITYIDSVFNKYNKIFPSITENEDSLVVAIYPSNKAWEDAKNKVSQSFKYKNRYYYYVNDATLNEVRIDTIKADSITETETINAILNNMFYSLYEQPAFDVKTHSVESVYNFFNTCDSLQSTKYYSTSNKHHQYAPDCWALTEGKEPIKCSNGYAFITDNFGFKANKSWQYDIEFEGESSYYIHQNFCKNLNSLNGSTQTVSEATRNPNIKGTVGNDSYRLFEPKSLTGKITVAYNIPNVLSGHYDVYVITVPNTIQDPGAVAKYSMFTASIVTDFDEKGNPIDSCTYSSGTEFHTNTTKVDTLLLFENIEFPYAYYGLPNAKPRVSMTSTYAQKNSKVATPNFYIDGFILKSRDE